MKLFFSFVLSVLTIQLVLSQNVPDMVVEIFRNGASYPISQQNDKYAFDNQGQIMPIGLRQQYNLGALMSRKYPDLLTTTDPTYVYTKSLETHKSVESMYAQLFGAFQGKEPNLPVGLSIDTTYPVFDDAVLADEVMAETAGEYQSVPYGFEPPNTFHEVKMSEEDMLNVDSSNCKYVAEKQKEREQNTLVSTVFNYLSDSVSTINQLGFNIHDMKSLAHFGDTLLAMYLEGMDEDLPQEIRHGTVVYKDAIFASQWYSTYILNGDPQELAIKSANLLNQISSWFGDTYNKNNTLKYAFMSGQESTLLPLLSLYNIVNDQCLLENHKSQKLGKEIPHPDCIFPEYSSQLIYEFYNLIGRPTVRFLYNGKPLQICSAGSVSDCEIHTFILESRSLVQGLTKNDFDNYCKLGSNHAGIHLPLGPVSITIPQVNPFWLMPILILIVVVFTYKSTVNKKQLSIPAAINSENREEENLTNEAHQIIEISVEQSTSIKECSI